MENNHYDPNQPRDKNGEWTDMPKHIQDKVKENIEAEKKTAIRSILSSNRDSVISSIKYVFKVYKDDDVRKKATEFLAYAQDNADLERLLASTRVKSDLKVLVQKMSIAQGRERDLKIYGTERPKLADIMAKGREIHEERGEVWHPIYKRWVKDENSFSSMSKHPKFT